MEADCQAGEQDDLVVWTFGDPAERGYITSKHDPVVKIDDIVKFLEPYVHDDGALEEGGDIEDTEQKRVCNFVHLVQDLCKPC